MNAMISHLVTKNSSTALFLVHPSPRRCHSQHKVISESQQPQKRSLTPPATRRSLIATPAAVLCCCGCSGRSHAAPGRNSFLDETFAAAMASGMADYEAAIASVKRRLFSQLQPTTERETNAGVLSVVEVGCGTGPNLQYYPQKSATNIIAVDPNAFMRPFLEQNMAAAGWAPEAVEWRLGVAEALPVADASVDAVVCTLVLCSVESVEAAVAEAKRVLRPGGRFLFIEHTAAQRGRPLLRVTQQVLSPLQQFFADGCHLTRDPLLAIESAAFGGGVEAMRFEVEGITSLIAPHVAGIALKA